jgi:hypothetical protein
VRKSLKTPSEGTVHNLSSQALRPRQRVPDSMQRLSCSSHGIGFSEAGGTPVKVGTRLVSS